ncbi:MAG TPA: hypothetical protein VF337_04285 [Candidatus Limnocylindrales bacterium]
MADAIQTVRPVGDAENAATFEWRGLHLHVVTLDQLTDEQVRMIARALPKVTSVGMFADLVGMILGRSVRIRTKRPSPDIRLEVGL